MLLLSFFWLAVSLGGIDRDRCDSDRLLLSLIDLLFHFYSRAALVVEIPCEEMVQHQV
jgi:hypothetical protein